MNKKTQFFHPSSAQKAFIYQQTQELASTLDKPSSISVFLEKLTLSSKNNYAVTFILDSSSMNILARSEGKDLLETSISAKNQMKKKLFTLSQSTENPKERLHFIEKMKQTPFYIH